MGPLPPDNDDRAIWDIWESQFILPAVTVADETGIWRELGNAALTTADLAERLSLNQRALAMLLAALASLALVEQRAGQWRALPAARRWLHPEAKGYWGGFLYRFRTSIPLHGNLLQALKTGQRPADVEAGGPEWERGDMSDEVAERIAHFMHAHSMAPARGAAQQSVFASVSHLMDIGCGSGVYGIELARAHPPMQVTLMDLAAMVRQAEGFASAEGVSGQVSTTACNMFTQPWPSGADAHFFANVFHDWSEETNRLIAQKSFAGLPSGGRIFLSEILLDDDGAGPWHAAAFSLLMLIGTLGRQYSLPEYRAMLESAGFTDVQAVRTGGGYYSLVSAVKP